MKAFKKQSVCVVQVLPCLCLLFVCFIILLGPPGARARPYDAPARATAYPGRSSRREGPSLTAAGESSPPFDERSDVSFLLQL